MTFNYPQIASAVYQACTTYDQYLPQLSPDVARSWAKVFSHSQLSPEDLLAGVDKVYSEQGAGYRPLPADISRAARAIRQDRTDRAPIPAIEDSHDDHHYPGDAKASTDPAPYPTEWDTEQRLSTYWYALSMHAMPHTTAGWEALAAQLKRKRAERESV